MRPVNLEEKNRHVPFSVVFGPDSESIPVHGLAESEPLASVNAELLEPSTHTSVCPWKGTANYYSLKVGDERNQNAVWSYAEPKEATRQIKGRVAFWKGVSAVP
jgi:hypothetical protein